MAGVERLAELEARYAMPTYARAPVEFVRGEGSRMWDSEGEEYIDLFSGLSVHNAGHCHPRIVAAIREQAGLIAGSSNLFYSEPAMRLAQRLVDSSLGGRAFLCNSGAEANECAIKLIRRHGHSRGIERPEIIVLESAFHGRTIATLAATPKLAREDLFGPLPQGFVAVADDDPDALAAAVGPNTAGVMIEPVQGESGVWPVAERVLVAARDACDRSGALLHFDEIQTGMGRTGTLWAYQGTTVRPNLITAAKALGGGLPVGACVIGPELGDGLERGEHGSTFAGGPIGAVAALAALELIDDPAVLAEVERLGGLAERLLEDLAGVAGVRRRGLMIGVALERDTDAAAAVAEALSRGVVANAPRPDTVRLLPALVIDEADLRSGIERLGAAISAVRDGS